MKRVIITTVLLASFLLTIVAAAVPSPPPPAEQDPDYDWETPIPGLPGQVTDANARPNTTTQGYHYPIYTTLITQAGGNTLSVEGGTVEVGLATSIIESKGSNVTMLNTQPLVIDPNAQVSFQDTTTSESNVDMNGNTVRAVDTIQSDNLALTLEGNTQTDIEAGSTVTLGGGSTDLTLTSTGSIRFNAGTDVDGVETTLSGSSNRVPTGAAVNAYVENAIQSAFQDLSSNTDSITATYPSATASTHEITITNGSNTQITDYYIPDNQNLTFTEDTKSSLNQRDIEVSIDDGNVVTVTDYYERDNFIPDDQTVSAGRSGNTVSLAIKDGSGTSFTDRHATYGAGAGLLVNAETFEVNSPTCNSSQALTWSGGFSCTDRQRELTGGSGVSISGDTVSSEAGTGIVDTGSGHALKASGQSCGGVAIGFSGGDLECANPSTSCSCPSGASDSDGQDILTSGTCTDYNGCVSGSCDSTTYSDQCSGSTVDEAYASGSSCSYTSTDCANQCFGEKPGTGCSSGACTTGSACRTDVSDSDGGYDTTTAGTCTNYKGCSTGSCSSYGTSDTCSGNTLYEKYISGYGTGDTCTSQAVNCPNGCSGGACNTVTCYPDDDGDGYGDESASGTQRVSCKSDEVQNNGDCYDSNAQARPGQTNWFTSDRGDGSFDYNCDGTTDRQDTSLGGYCTGSVATSCGNFATGWDTLPTCGETETYWTFGTCQCICSTSNPMLVTELCPSAGGCDNGGTQTCKASSTSKEDRTLACR